MSILIVDDEAEIREMLDLMLSKAGYQVECVGNGEEAVKKFQNMCYDLLITDVVMPEKDGVAAMLELRELCPNVKIIAMSGGGVIPPETYLEVAAKLGATKTFTKPLNTRELLSAVVELIGEPEN
jgi:DNA-binding response OmpR family regulator